MDWVTFTSNAISSLSWPVVVLVLLIMVRRQLVGLAGRLIKLSLPGGVEASFGKGLEESREKVEEILIEDHENNDEDDETRTISGRATDSEGQKEFDLAQSFPEAAVLEAFKKVEDILLKNTDKLSKIRKGRGLMSYIRALHETETIDTNTIILFEKLYQLRSLAAHGGGPSRIMPGEALEYQEQCDILIDKLEMAFDHLNWQQRNNVKNTLE